MYPNPNDNVCVDCYHKCMEEDCNNHSEHKCIVCRGYICNEHGYEDEFGWYCSECKPDDSSSSSENGGSSSSSSGNSSSSLERCENCGEPATYTCSLCNKKYCIGCVTDCDNDGTIDHCVTCGC